MPLSSLMKRREGGGGVYDTCYSHVSVIIRKAIWCCRKCNYGGIARNIDIEGVRRLVKLIRDIKLKKGKVTRKSEWLHCMKSQKWKAFWKMKRKYCTYRSDTMKENIQIDAYTDTDGTFHEWGVPSVMLFQNKVLIDEVMFLGGVPVNCDNILMDLS